MKYTQNIFLPTLLMLISLLSLSSCDGEDVASELINNRYEGYYVIDSHSNPFLTTASTIPTAKELDDGEYREGAYMRENVPIYQQYYIDKKGKFYSWYQMESGKCMKSEYVSYTIKNVDGKQLMVKDGHQPGEIMFGENSVNKSDPGSEKSQIGKKGQVEYFYNVVRYPMPNKNLFIVWRYKRIASPVCSSETTVPETSIPKPIITEQKSFHLLYKNIGSLSINLTSNQSNLSENLDNATLTPIDKVVPYLNFYQKEGGGAIYIIHYSNNTCRIKWLSNAISVVNNRPIFNLDESYHSIFYGKSSINKENPKTGTNQVGAKSEVEYFYLQKTEGTQGLQTFDKYVRTKDEYTCSSITETSDLNPISTDIPSAPNPNPPTENKIVGKWNVSFDYFGTEHKGVFDITELDKQQKISGTFKDTLNTYTIVPEMSSYDKASGGILITTKVDGAEAWKFSGDVDISNLKMIGVPRIETPDGEYSVVLEKLIPISDTFDAEKQ